MPAIISFSRPLVLLGLLALSVSMASAATLGSPLGEWKTIDDETGQPKALIDISEHAGELQGRIVRLFRAPTEDQNPLCVKCSGALHDQPIIGMTVLTGLKADGEEWSGGEILDPNNGKVYRCKMALDDAGRKLMVRGFIGISLFGRSQVWERGS